uniref:Uncharacterized protein n=1 Tax=Leersia perrieri TaxID=77586 RepID=A0A0D9XYT9_9ORYZ
MDQKARRRHVVPAFGEWNYYYNDQLPDQMMRSAPVVAEWYASSYTAEAEACSDVWFKYSPPPLQRPTPKKARRPAAEGRVAPEKATPYHDGGKVVRPPRGAAAASSYHYSGGVAAAKVAARTPARSGGGCRVVKRAVDADLYQVPPPEFASSRPRRKRAGSSLWMGCLGLNCVA